MGGDVSVIIVTHNSQPVIEECLSCLEKQRTEIEKVYIVDSGSEDTNYLCVLQKKYNFSLTCLPNIGFAAANNVGVEKIGNKAEFVLFLNPDAFVEPRTLLEARKIMLEKEQVGVLTGILYRYDLRKNLKTQILDSTGVFRTWYGRWYDRGQGQEVTDAYCREEQVPAACGAFMFCRLSAFQFIMPEIFDASFFMYKEDIDLSLRLAAKGWKILYTPRIVIYHCRGWSEKRRDMDRDRRLLAARNEVKLTVKHQSPYLIWAAAKYLAVRLFNL